MTVPNYGASSIIDIEYSYRIKDIDSLQSRIQKLNDEHYTGNKEEDNYLYYKSELRPEMPVNCFILSSGVLTQSIFIHNDKLKADALRPNENTHILLPSYFLAINNYLLELTYTSLNFPNIKASQSVDLEIICTDAEKRNWKFDFEIFIEPLKVRTENKKSNGEINISFKFLAQHQNMFLTLQYCTRLSLHSKSRRCL